MLQMNDFVYVENALIVLESASLIYGSVNPQGLLQLAVWFTLSFFTIILYIDILGMIYL